MDLHIHTRDAPRASACREKITTRGSTYSHAALPLVFCAWQRKYPRVKISCENKYRPVMPSRALTGNRFYTTYIPFARLAVTRIEAIPFTRVAAIPFTFVFTTSRQHEVTPQTNTSNKPDKTCLLTLEDHSVNADIRDVSFTI